MTNPFLHFREIKNLNLTQAAARVGVDKSTYLRWQRGSHRPDIKSLPRLCKVMGVSRKKLRPDVYGAMQ